MSNVLAQGITTTLLGTEDIPTADLRQSSYDQWIQARRDSRSRRYSPDVAHHDEVGSLHANLPPTLDSAPLTIAPCALT